MPRTIAVYVFPTKVETAGFDIIRARGASHVFYSQGQRRAHHLPVRRRESGQEIAVVVQSMNSESHVIYAMHNLDTLALDKI